MADPMVRLSLPQLAEVRSEAWMRGYKEGLQEVISSEEWQHGYAEGLRAEIAAARVAAGAAVPTPTEEPTA